MTLPRINALLEHWAEFPPVHIGMTCAWLERNNKSSSSRGSRGRSSGPAESDMSAFLGMPGVGSTWIGPPPMRAEDAMRTIDAMRLHGNG